MASVLLSGRRAPWPARSMARWSLDRLPRVRRASLGPGRRRNATWAKRIFNPDFPSCSSPCSGSTRPVNSLLRAFQIPCFRGSQGRNRRIANRQRADIARVFGAGAKGPDKKFPASREFGKCPLPTGAGMPSAFERRRRRPLPERGAVARGRNVLEPVEIEAETASLDRPRGNGARTPGTPAHGATARASRRPGCRASPPSSSRRRCDHGRRA